MRHILFFIAFFSVFSSFGHEYFFAFAEVEYDELNGRLEATLIVTTHDFEKYLQKNKIIEHDLSRYKTDTTTIQFIENEINKHFHLNLNPGLENSITEGAELFHFKLEGYEIQLTGTVEFYLSYELNRPLEIFEVLFDLLMNEYPQQQNKLTFSYRGTKKTYVFLSNKRTQLIDLH